MKIWIGIAFEFINLGLAAGLLLGALLLLRPVTKRLLTPRQRVVLWMVGWLSAYFPRAYLVFSGIKLLPYTFGEWITPRTAGPWRLPAYLPGNYSGPGEYHLAFPGGGALLVYLTDRICSALALAWLAGIVLVALRLYLGSRRLKQLAMQGELLEEEHPFYRIPDQTVGIWLCGNLATSFVSHRAMGGCRIFLQSGLPPEQMELVLRHEASHIALRHCWCKGYATVGLVLHWWNPLIWLSYFQFCRDLELDCDRHVMNELDAPQRRAYARTLLELGTGRQLWDAPLCFGECDAAVRVKAAAAWRPSQWWRILLTWCATALVFACLTGGAGGEKLLPADQILWHRQAQEQWQAMTQENVETFIWKQEQELKDRGWIPREAHIVQGWQRIQDQNIYVWYQLNTTTWRDITYTWLAPERFTLYQSGQQAEVPDRTDYQRFW